LLICAKKLRRKLYLFVTSLADLSGSASNGAVNNGTVYIAYEIYVLP